MQETMDPVVGSQEADARKYGPEAEVIAQLEETTVSTNTCTTALDKDSDSQEKVIIPGPSSPTAADPKVQNGSENNTVDSVPQQSEESKASGDATFQSANDDSAPAKELNHIVFVDPLGTRWAFPYEAAKTWNEAKDLVKAVYVDILLHDRYAQLLDRANEGTEQSFKIVKLRSKPGDDPEETSFLSRHWETLVRPGWEFQIVLDGYWDILTEISEAKAARKAIGRTEESHEDQVLKISYVAKYLVPDDDGLLLYHSEQQFRSRIADRKGLGSVASGVVLEEQREVSCSNKEPNTPIETRIENIGIPILYIRSHVLLDALKAVISFQAIPDTYFSKRWRGRDITSSLEQGRFVYPFTDLWHYREKLLEYRESVQDTHDAEYSKTCRDDIDTLLGYLRQEPPIPVDQAELMWSHSSPKATFGALWLLLKPGSDVYVREHGHLVAYVLESCSGGPKWTSPESRAWPYRAHVWNLNFNGEVLTRSVKEVVIPVFDGEREIRALPVFPVEFHADEDPANPLRQRLISRGKSFVEMVKKPTFREYSGPSRLQGIREFNRARVVIDHTSQPWNLKHASADWKDEKEVKIPVTEITGVELSERVRVPGCPCKACHASDSLQQGLQSRTFDDYDNIDLSTKSELTDHQYMLCWSHVYGFVLKDRAWDLLDVNRLELPRIQKNIIDLLVMKPETNKHMIKAVCEIYGGTYTQTFSSDFIHGKGEGQIFLLHGPPGTGKTLTAESVAEYSGRPLLSLTAADLGQEPEALEQNLLRFFRDAKKWNAIVILDEADVYLETRSSQDLRRNSIVSIFLRALDYFQGILFLTTNRVGSFDEAFMSRIHVQIGYDLLDDGSRQQIWDNHFKKLARNRELNGQEIRCSYDAKEFVRKSKDLQVLKWNGREIRNAFQTAVALACYQAKQEGNEVPELTDEHLRQVVSMSRNFKTYLHNVRGTEGEMAYAARLRNDEVKASGKDN